MSLKIDQDHTRFRKIVRGKIRENLRQYISKGEMLGKQGKDVVSIPVPHIDIPRFRFGGKQQGGVGQGEGEAGDPIGGEPGEGDGQGKAGSDPGQHAIEVELTLEELNHVNFDWFTPKNCHRHTPEEVRSWFAGSDFTLTWFRVEPSGITVVADRA